MQYFRIILPKTKATVPITNEVPSSSRTPTETRESIEKNQHPFSSHNPETQQGQRRPSRPVTRCRKPSKYLDDYIMD